jgi:hypothetical protein
MRKDQRAKALFTPYFYDKLAKWEKNARSREDWESGPGNSEMILTGPASRGKKV